MLELDLKIKRWGNSIATILPERVVKETGIKPGKTIRGLVPTKELNLKKDFGSLKFKKTTDKLIRETYEQFRDIPHVEFVK